MKATSILSILLLAAAPEALASQCNMQAKIQITPEGRRAIWKVFKMNLNRVQKEIDNKNETARAMDTARALNEAFEFIENSSRDLNTLSKDTIDLSTQLGILKEHYTVSETGVRHETHHTVNQDVCEVIREQRAQEMVALDNPETPNSLVYQAVKNILNTMQQKASEAPDSDNDDDDDVKNLRGLVASMTIQGFYKSVHDDSYAMGDSTPIERSSRERLIEFSLIDSGGKVLPVIREAMLKHEAEQECARLLAKIDSSTKNPEQ